MAPVTLKALPPTSIVDPSSQSKRATIQVMPIASIQPMPGEAETCWTQEVQQTLQILGAIYDSLSAGQSAVLSPKLWGLVGCSSHKFLAAWT